MQRNRLPVNLPYAHKDSGAGGADNVLFKCRGVPPGDGSQEIQYHRQQQRRSFRTKQTSFRERYVPSELTHARPPERARTRLLWRLQRSHPLQHAVLAAQRTRNLCWGWGG